MNRTSSFSQTLQASLLAKASMRTEPKGAVLFRRGEPSIGIFLVQRGSVSRRLETSDGRAILDCTVSRGGIVGLPATLSGGRYSLTALTIEETEVAFVERHALTELMQGNAAIALEMVKALGEELIQMREVLASNPTVPQRRTNGTGSAQLGDRARMIV